MNTFTCDDKATLVSYLYGELDEATRGAVDTHLAQCASCAAEVTALGDVRSELGLWAAPDVELDFAIVKKSQLPAATVLRPARWWQTVPAWAQAAAAILVVAAGASVANLQIKSGPEGFSVTTGWMTPAAAPALAASSADRGEIDRQVEGQLASLEQRLRNEIRAARETSAGPARVAATSADDATIRRVQQLIADAEQRHSRELAARFVEFTNDLALQRRADLMNVQRAINAQDAQMFRQRQFLNNAIRVSTTPQQ
jgi:hypothetical protein